MNVADPQTDLDTPTKTDIADLEVMREVQCNTEEKETHSTPNITLTDTRTDTTHTTMTQDTKRTTTWKTLKGKTMAFAII